jgi:hypothetical protein
MNINVWKDDETLRKVKVTIVSGLDSSFLFFQQFHILVILGGSEIHQQRELNSLFAALDLPIIPISASAKSRHSASSKFSNFLSEAKGRSIMVEEFAYIQSARDQSIPLVFEGYQEHNLGIHYSYRSPVPFLSTGWISRSKFQREALQRFGLNNFGEIDQFALITPSTNTEIVFPAYMNHAFGDFILKDSLTTANFILLHYSLRNKPEGD